jgi:hypothetical protein
VTTDILKECDVGGYGTSPDYDVCRKRGQLLMQRRAQELTLCCCKNQVAAAAATAAAPGSYRLRCSEHCSKSDGCVKLARPLLSRWQFKVRHLCTACVH